MDLPDTHRRPARRSSSSPRAQVQANVSGAQVPGDSFYHIGPTQATARYDILLQLPAGLVCNGIDSKCIMQASCHSMPDCRKPHGWAATVA